MSNCIVKIPQLRVVTNSFCGKKCLYCRTSGEGSALVRKGSELSPREMTSLIEFLVRHGIYDVRITGGEPVYYDGLEELIASIRQIGVSRISIVTRDGLIADQVESLKSAGLAQITFSIDSLDSHTWCSICGLSSDKAQEHRLLLNAVDAAKRSGLRVRINTVVIRGVNDTEMNKFIAFAEELEIEVKFMEVIRDIAVNKNHLQTNGWELHQPLDVLSSELTYKTSGVDTIYQPGGLGHPMLRFVTSGGATVIIKTLLTGAFYGKACHICQFWPCDDALMALRILPDGKIQKCLLRNDNLLDLHTMENSDVDKALVVAEIGKILDSYRTARFYAFEDLEPLRMKRLYGDHHSTEQETLN